MKRHGFTLMELLVVIAIISLLTGVLVPSLARARRIVREVICRSSLRQVHVAASAYAHNDSRGRYPLEATEHNPHRPLLERLNAYEDDGLMRSFFCPEANTLEPGAGDPAGGTPLGAVDSVIDTPENRQLGNITYIYWSFEKNKTEATGLTWRNPLVFFPRALLTTGMRSVDHTPNKFRNVRTPSSEIWVFSDFFRQQGVFPHGRRSGSQGGGLNIVFLDGHADIVFGRPQDSYK
jgi:prepilin-type N-terminal cleavage/methylation domain-containing protein/prepilin-type processing-associated H-X9-DG protein